MLPGCCVTFVSVLCQLHCPGLWEPWDKEREGGFSGVILGPGSGVKADVGTQKLAKVIWMAASFSKMVQCMTEANVLLKP